MKPFIFRIGVQRRSDSELGIKKSTLRKCLCPMSLVLFTACLRGVVYLGISVMAYSFIFESWTPIEVSNFAFVL